MINKLCATYGTYIGKDDLLQRDWHAFPSFEQLESVTQVKLNSLGNFDCPIHINDPLFRSTRCLQGLGIGLALS